LPYKQNNNNQINFMIKQNPIHRFAFLAAFLLAAIHVEAGAPLGGIDIKLGKNPGGGGVARTTTDGAGHFSFPAQPAGSYTITIASTEPAEVTVQGAVGGAIKKSSGAASSAAKAAPAPLKVDLKSDGKTPITGTVNTTIRKGHSNSINN
jgi:carboxypeptidase family protein